MAQETQQWLIKSGVFMSIPSLANSVLSAAPLLWSSNRTCHSTISSAPRRTSLANRCTLPTENLDKTGRNARTRTPLFFRCYETRGQQLLDADVSPLETGKHRGTQNMKDRTPKLSTVPASPWTLPLARRPPPGRRCPGEPSA
eukprot:scaffold106_cov246-Pinguiococcus_pyrenoidosus.AAC.9